MITSNNRIKILQTIRQGQIGGGESHVLDLVTNLDKTRFEPVVLSFTDGPMVEKLKQQGIKTYVVETLRPFNIATYKEVKKIMLNEEINILHAHGTRALSNTIFPANSLGIPVIYTVHGWSFHQDQKFPVRHIRELSEKFLTDHVDLTISVSQSNQNDGLHRFNMKRSRVVNYGIDLNRFNPNKSMPDLRSELEIENGKTVVGFLVRMTTQKDPFTLVRAIAEVAKTTKDIQFLFIGDGDLKKATIKLAADLGVTNMIKFHKFRQDVPEVLNAFDIYTLPSLWEGLPIGMLEAMAMKKAVIATPVDGSKEAITNNQNGILVPCQDHKALAAAIVKLHLNKQQRIDLGEAAYQTIHQRFDLKMMVEQNEHIYLEFTKSSSLAA
ncbi:glycosyltransferase family 4 protein [soil metagenome]